MLRIVCNLKGWFLSYFGGVFVQRGLCPGGFCPTLVTSGPSGGLRISNTNGLLVMGFQNHEFRVCFGVEIRV